MHLFIVKVKMIEWSIRQDHIRATVAIDEELQYRKIITAGFEHMSVFSHLYTTQEPFYVRIQLP